MNGTERFYVACCQTDLPVVRSHEQIRQRVDRMADMIEHAVLGYEPFFDVRLVLFPEFAHGPPIYMTIDKLRERLAVPVPNEHTDRYQRLARKHGIWIQTGTFIEYDERYPEALFNTTCLIGPDGLLAKYRKTHPWLPWELHASPHDLPNYDEDPFPVVDTEIGRLGCAICYDWLFPEAIRQLALKGAEILIRLAAYMSPWGTTHPMEWWSIINRCRAIENVAYVAAVNQGAQLANYPPFSWPGGSMIVDYDGRILAQADPGPGEHIVVGPIDLAALRAERRRRIGHAMLAHLRTELYRCYGQPIYPQAAATGNWPISYEGNCQATVEGWKRVEKSAQE